jgi:hypothetical protein
MSKLKKQTIRDFLENLPLLERGGVISATEYARELIYEDYAPDFSSLALHDERFSTVPKGPISPEDSQRLGELEEQLEAAWWARTGNALLKKLLSHWKSKLPKEKDTSNA